MPIIIVSYLYLPIDSNPQGDIEQVTANLVLKGVAEIKVYRKVGEMSLYSAKKNV